MSVYCLGESGWWGYSHTFIVSRSHLSTAIFPYKEIDFAHSTHVTSLSLCWKVGDTWWTRVLKVLICVVPEASNRMSTGRVGITISFFFSVMLCCIAHRTAYCIVIPRKYIILHTQLASANEPIWYCYEMQLNHYTIRELHRKKCPSYGWWNTVADPNDVHNIYIYKCKC